VDKDAWDAILLDQGYEQGKEMLALRHRADNWHRCLDAVASMASYGQGLHSHFLGTRLAFISWRAGRVSFFILPPAAIFYHVYLSNYATMKLLFRSIKPKSQLAKKKGSDVVTK
jgi:hypothetical protein